MSKKINYDKVIKKSLLFAIRDIMSDVATNGFFKDQHLYITFSLEHPMVKAPEFLKKEFGSNLTIVLQYEFWDLKVDDYGFFVSLAFENSDETLYIPFSSIIFVQDPSEDFAMEFTPDFDEAMPSTENKKKPQSSNIVSLDAFRKP